MELPNEIRDRVIDYVYNRQDILSLALVDRSWSNCAVRKLYTNVQLTISHDGSHLEPLEKLLSSSGVNLEFTTSLAVLPQHTTPESDLVRMAVVEDGSEVPARTRVGKVREPKGKGLNMLMRLLLAKIPTNKLESFVWAQDLSISIKTTDQLAKYHGKSLRRLCLRDRSNDWRHEFLVTSLKTLSITFLYSGTAAARLLVSNSSTLREVELGIEGDMVDAFFDFQVVTEDVHSQLLCKRIKEFTDSTTTSQPVLKLETLKLIGLNIQDLLLGGPFRPLTDLSHLRRLTLESCFDIRRAFNMLANKSREESVNRLPNLQSLSIRQEHVDRHFSMARLESFLCSLSPLKTLCILLSGDFPNRRLNKILKVHGVRLEALVWDEREGRRHCIHNDRLVGTANHDRERLHDITTYCPELVELGVPVLWADEYFGPGEAPKGKASKIPYNLRAAPLRKHERQIDVVQLAGLFRKLPHLRTLNIRNMPETGSTKDGGWDSISSRFHELARMVVEDLVEATSSEARYPRLRIIGLGALAYRDVYDGSVVNGSTDLDEYLRLRVYAIDYHYDARGKLVPLLTTVANGYPGNVGEDISRNMSIFEPYWLG